MSDLQLKTSPFSCSARFSTTRGFPPKAAWQMLSYSWRVMAYPLSDVRPTPAILLSRQSRKNEKPRLPGASTITERPVYYGPLSSNPSARNLLGGVLPAPHGPGLTMHPFGSCLFPGVDTPTADGMTRLLSLDRVTPASHFAGMWDALSRISITVFLQGLNRPRRLPCGNGQTSQPRSPAPSSRNPVFAAFRSAPRKEGTRIPKLSKSNLLATFFSRIHIIAFSAPVRKNPSSQAQTIPRCRPCCYHSPGNHSPYPAARFRRPARRRAGSPRA